MTAVAGMETDRAISPSPSNAGTASPQLNGSGFPVTRVSRLERGQRDRFRKIYASGRDGSGRDATLALNLQKVPL